MNLLIMDDNEQITSLLSKILNNKGYHVTVSNTFQSGLELLRAETFDAVLIDAPMPNFDNLTVISEFEKEGILQSHKVILFTGLDITSSTILELKTKGLYSYLKKPIEVEKLLQELSSIPSITNSEITEKRVAEEQTKKKLENLRSSLSSLKLKLSPT